MDDRESEIVFYLFVLVLVWGFLFVFSKTVNSERNCERSRICASRWKVGHQPARGAVGVKHKEETRGSPGSRWEGKEEAV